jgi:hypothetical protein
MPNPGKGKREKGKGKNQGFRDVVFSTHILMLMDFSPETEKRNSKMGKQPIIRRFWLMAWWPTTSDS